MQIYYLWAGIIAIGVGVTHSLFGEILIFNRLRINQQVVPTAGHPILRERHVRILWASWHLVTTFGCTMGAILLANAMPNSGINLQVFVLRAIGTSMFIAAALVLFATKGMHPGWLGLLAVAVWDRVG